MNGYQMTYSPHEKFTNKYRRVWKAFAKKWINRRILIPKNTPFTAYKFCKCSFYYLFYLQFYAHKNKKNFDIFASYQILTVSKEKIAFGWLSITFSGKIRNRAQKCKSTSILIFKWVIKYKTLSRAQRELWKELNDLSMRIFLKQWLL